MQLTHLPAWCETRGEPGIDGRYTVACYFTSAGHPVSREHAERVELIEYAPDGTRLRVDVGTIDRSPYATSGAASGATSAMATSTLSATMPYTARARTSTSSTSVAAHPRPATLRRRQNG